MTLSKLPFIILLTTAASHLFAQSPNMRVEIVPSIIIDEPDYQISFEVEWDLDGVINPCFIKGEMRVAPSLTWTELSLPSGIKPPLTTPATPPAPLKQTGKATFTASTTSLPVSLRAQVECHTSLTDSTVVLSEISNIETLNPPVPGNIDISATCRLGYFQWKKTNIIEVDVTFHKGSEHAPYFEIHKDDPGGGLNFVQAITVGVLEKHLIKKTATIYVDLPGDYTLLGQALLDVDLSPAGSATTTVNCPSGPGVAHAANNLDYDDPFVPGYISTHTISSCAGIRNILESQYNESYAYAADHCKGPGTLIEYYAESDMNACNLITQASNSAITKKDVDCKQVCDGVTGDPNVVTDQCISEKLTIPAVGGAKEFHVGKCACDADPSTNQSTFYRHGQNDYEYVSYVRGYETEPACNAGGSSNGKITHWSHCVDSQNLLTYFPTVELLPGQNEYIPTECGDMVEATLVSCNAYCTLTHQEPIQATCETISVGDGNIPLQNAGRCNCGMIVEKLVFDESPTTALPNDCVDVGGILTKGPRLDKFLGIGVPVRKDITVDLTSDVADGKFYIDDMCTQEVTSVTIEAEKYYNKEGTIYYQSPTSGSHTITASENPDDGWQDATATFTLEDPGMGGNY